MDVNLRAIQNRQIEQNMDSMSLQMNCMEKLDVAQLIMKSGIADLLKSLGILKEVNKENENQLKLFRQNKKALR
ncbi:MAG: hypothetical protein ACYCXO_10055 [Candidatus Humimicrobiaceae bacterium]